MIIDINACVGNWVFRPLPSSSPLELSKKLSQDGIGKALVSPIEGIFYDDPQLANERLFAIIDRFSSLVPVAVINPSLPNWEKSLHKCYENKIKAIKLYPNYHRYNIYDAKKLLEQAGQMGLPVIVQLRVQDVRAQNPICIVPDVDIKGVVGIIAELPETSFILGGIKWNEAQSMADAIKELHNVWLDISNAEYIDVLRRLIALYGAEKLLFGTHAPFFVIKSAILKLKEADLSDKEFGLITEINSKNLLAYDKFS